MPDAHGQVSKWLKEPDCKSGRHRRSGVQIPPCPLDATRCPRTGSRFSYLFAGGELGLGTFRRSSSRRPLRRQAAAHLQRAGVRCHQSRHTPVYVAGKYRPSALIVLALRNGGWLYEWIQEAPVGFSAGRPWALHRARRVRKATDRLLRRRGWIPVP